MLRRLSLAPDTRERHLVARRLLGPLRGARVVDVGGRPGIAAAFFPRAAAVVAANVDEPADLVVDRTRLPFGDGAFDAVLSLDVLEHVPPPQRVTHVDELVRVAAGPVALSTPFGGALHRRVEEELQEWLVRRRGAPHPFLQEHLDLGLVDEGVVASLVERHGLRAYYHGDVARAAALLRATVDARSRPWRTLPLMRWLWHGPDTELADAPYPSANRVFLVRT